jgi:hypothetical protein
LTARVPEDYRFIQQDSVPLIGTQDCLGGS